MNGEFQAIGTEVGALVELKNSAYGGAFQGSAALLRLFYPNGIHPDQYLDATLITRICDKLFRIANAKHAFGESPYKDITGYGILGTWMDGFGREGVRVPIPVPLEHPPFGQVAHIASDTKIEPSDQSGAQTAPLFQFQGDDTGRVTFRAGRSFVVGSHLPVHTT